MSAKTDDLLRSALIHNHHYAQNPETKGGIKVSDGGDPVRSFEDDNVFMDLSANAAGGFLPAALGQIKNIVKTFVGKLGLPFCNKRQQQIEEELSQSISQALLEASSYLDQDSSQLLMNDLSSISASLHHSQLTSQLNGQPFDEATAQYQT